MIDLHVLRLTRGMIAARCADMGQVWAVVYMLRAEYRALPGVECALTVVDMLDAFDRAIDAAEIAETVTTTGALAP